MLGRYFRKSWVHVLFLFKFTSLDSGLQNFGKTQAIEITGLFSNDIPQETCYAKPASFDRKTGSTIRGRAQSSGTCEISKALRFLCKPSVFVEIWRTHVGAVLRDRRRHVGTVLHTHVGTVLRAVCRQRSTHAAWYTAASRTCITEIGVGETTVFLMFSLGSFGCITCRDLLFSPQVTCRLHPCADPFKKERSDYFLESSCAYVCTHACKHAGKHAGMQEFSGARFMMLMSR